MTDAHRCAGCTRLFYPHPGAMRCDAVIVTITDATWTMLEKAARNRADATKGLGDRGGVGAKHDLYLKCLLGAAGEWAAARALGLPFDGKPFGLDVGPYNVRTRSKHDYELIVQDHDLAHHPDVPYLLVTTEYDWRGLILRGWMTPAETRPEWRQEYGDYRSAFFVPQAELHDLRRLPEGRAIA